MLAYLIVGLVVGSIYALTAAGLVVAYSSSGVLNFAYGAQAYFVARMYYFLHSQRGWSIAPAALVCIVAVSPMMGALLWIAVFRLLRISTTLIKIVVTIGLSVALPPIAVLLFGNVEANTVPGLAPVPVHVFHVFGAGVTLDQVIVLGSVLVVGAAGASILRLTDIGLTVRALVDSEALTAISGTNPTLTSIGVWAVTSFLAGLAGVLVAPVIGLTASNFTLLVAASFAAVIVAKLRNIGRAVVAGVALGLVGGVIERYVPAGSLWSTATTNSVPFAAIFLALILYVRRGEANESGSVGGFLDRAIAVAGGGTVSGQRATPGPGPATVLPPSAAVAPEDGPEGPAKVRAEGLQAAKRRWWGIGVLALAVALAPLFLGGIWEGLLGEGAALGVVFLSYSLLAGDGGMVWLCQVTFAGIGAVTTAELATNAHWPVLLAVLAGGLITVPIGIVIAVLTVRLGDLYVALVTLTFAVLMDNLVFSLNVFYQYGSGIGLYPPSFAGGARALTYLMLFIFAVVALLVASLRSSTAGLALVAVRWSEPAARTIGLSVLETKVLVSAIAAFVAGVGGGLLAIISNAAITSNFSTLVGLVWLAVLVTIGIRSTAAALVAGMVYAFVPALFSTYAPTSVLELPTALFGVGAVLVARNPEGTVASVVERARVFFGLSGMRSGKESRRGVPAPADEVSTA